MKIHAWVLAAGLAAVAGTSSAATYYVRADGGTAEQCNGLSNVEYPGSGTGLSCAWKNPMIALPPVQDPVTRMVGGDTLYIQKSGAFPIGFGVPGAEACDVAKPERCVMRPVPSGTAAQPTKIIGRGVDANSCGAVRGKLLGHNGTRYVLNLIGTHNAVMDCLEITDNDTCIDGHANLALKCNIGIFPYGPWGLRAIYALDSENVKLNHLNIHGMGSHGIMAGRLKNWTIQSSRLAFNGNVGWDGDVKDMDENPLPSSNSGTIKFTNVVFEYNGCSDDAAGQPLHCWSAYGDGLGTTHTAGNWEFIDVSFFRNTSDGLDLKYHDLGGKVIINRVTAMDNASNQIKVKGTVLMTNSYARGYCSYFEGKPFNHGVQACRALGDTVVFELIQSGQKIEAYNNTVISEGNVSIWVDGPAGSTAILTNNIMVGHPYYHGPGRKAGDVGWPLAAITVDETYSVKQNLYNAVCTTPNTICGNAGLVNSTLANGNPVLKSTSVARDSGADVPLPDDLYNAPRPINVRWDRGATEYQTP